MSEMLPRPLSATELQKVMQERNCSYEVALALTGGLSGWERHHVSPTRPVPPVVVFQQPPPVVVVQQMPPTPVVVFQQPPPVVVVQQMPPIPVVALGTVVQCRWKGRDRYYQGKVTAIDGEWIHINYDDGDKEWTTADMIRLVVQLPPHRNERHHRSQQGPDPVFQNFAAAAELQERLEKLDNILERGLCSGRGTPTGQMSLEAAVAQVMNLPFPDEPNHAAMYFGFNLGDMTSLIRYFTIKLNDASWSSPGARAKGLRRFGIAQIKRYSPFPQKFVEKLSRKINEVLITKLFTEFFPNIQWSTWEAAYAYEYQHRKHKVKWIAAYPNEAAFIAFMAASVVKPQGSVGAAAAKCAELSSNAACWADGRSQFYKGRSKHNRDMAADCLANVAHAIVDATASQNKQDEYLTLIAELAAETLGELT